MIRILSIENHKTIIVSGLRLLFRAQRDGIEISCSAESVAEALQTRHDSQFDLILLDLWIPNETPVENVQLLREHFPGKPILIYSSEDSKEQMRIMAKAGVNGYLTRDASRRELQEGIKRVAGGGSWFLDLSFSEDEQRTDTDASAQIDFTMLQKKMLELYKAGNNIKKISVELHTSPNQIEKSFERMRLKFGVKTNAELFALYLQKEKN